MDKKEYAVQLKYSQGAIQIPYPIDYEDVGRKKELIDQRKKAAADEAYYLEFKPSPYFGRLDLDSQNSPASCKRLIGENVNPELND